MALIAGTDLIPLHSDFDSFDPATMTLMGWAARPAVEPVKITVQNYWRLEI
jgi:hypothetical protein